jgi:hypothetical protein
MKIWFTVLTAIIILLTCLFVINSCKDKPTETPALETKISGKVTDKSSNAEIAGVQITTNPTTSSVTTDATGNYTIPNVTPGQYLVTAIKNGYKSTSINVVAIEGETVTADLQLPVLGPELSVSTTSINFGTTQTSASIMIGNKTGVGTVSWSLSISAAWLTSSATSGSLTTGTNTVTLTANRTGLSYGNYNTILTITSNGGNIDIPVSLAVPNPSAPQLTVSPLQLNLGETQSSSTITISNTGTGTLVWSASTAQNWIAISPTGDSTKTELDNVTITVNRAGLSPNSYNGEITINSNAGSQTVQVLMAVATVPTLALSTTTLDFDSSQTVKTFTISNSGSGTLNWTAAGNQTWMTVNPESGTDQSTVNVTVNRGSLSYGSYSGIVTINSNGGNNAVDVLMKVAPPPPPTAVTLGNPTNMTTSSMTLAWSKSTESNFAAYRLYRDTSPAVTENSTLVTTITDKDVNSYNVTGLNSGTVYYFKVYVMNSSQVTSGSNTVTGTTQLQLKTWSVLSTPTMIDDVLYALDALNSSFVYTGGYNGIFFYNGINWYKDSLANMGQVYDIKIIDQSDIWCVGSNVYHYNGINWSIPSGGPPDRQGLDDKYTSIDAVDDNNVWIGTVGKIYYFNGSSWTITSLSSDVIISIDMVDVNNGWAIDFDGKVFYYNGIGWAAFGSSQTAAGDNATGEISVINSSDIWTVGFNGGAAHYDGSSWSQYKDPSTQNSLGYVFSVQMLSTNIGWAVGSSGHIYYYNGTKWQSVASPNSTSLSKIRMINANDGWAVGYNGIVLRYH